MYNRLLKILVLLLAFMACSNVVYAQSENSCQGKCEWEVMMRDMLDDYTAIIKYDYKDKISRADMHHLSYMTNIVTQIPLYLCNDKEISEHYVCFIVSLLQKFGTETEVMKEIAAGREMNLPDMDFFSADILTKLQLVAFVMHSAISWDALPDTFEVTNYGNLHFLERVLYGDDVVMSAKDPYYAEVLGRLCDRLEITFDMDTAEGDVLECVQKIVRDEDLDTFSSIWEDVLRLSYCVNIQSRSDVQGFVLLYALNVDGMDAYIREMGVAMRERFSDEFCKMFIPLYSMRFRAFEELYDIMQYVEKQISAGKRYAVYLPWACPQEYRTGGFDEYRENMMKLSRILIRTLGYEMITMRASHNQESMSSFLSWYGASNIYELIFIIGNFALELLYEGNNDAYTVIEDIYRFAGDGIYDTYQMARIADAYSSLNFSKAEQIIDDILIPSIAQKEYWEGYVGAEFDVRIDAMMLTSYTCLTVNKDKYMDVVEEYVGEIEKYLENVPTEEKLGIFPSLVVIYAYMGRIDDARNMIGYLIDNGKDDNVNTLMFLCHYQDEKYDEAVRCVDMSLAEGDVVYTLMALEVAFRTGDHKMAQELSRIYLSVRYNLTDDLLMALPENKSELYSIMYERDVEAIKNILESAYGQDDFSTLLSTLIYDWNIISKGSLLRSQQNWHNYMVTNDDRTFGAYDLFNAYAEDYDSTDPVTPMQGAYVSIVSHELSDVIRKENGVEKAHVGRPTFKQVARSLRKGEYAIEFSSIGDEYYAAVVGKGYASPKLYHLCSRQDMADVSDDLFNEYLYGDTDALRKLYGLVWEPLLKDMPEGADIYCSLDGVLNLLNVELFCDGSSRYVGDVYDIHRVSTTASLNDAVRLKDIKTAVFYGNLNYDMTSTEISADSDKYIYDAAATQYRGAVMDYMVPREYLRDTGEEVRSASGLLEDQDINVLKFEWNDGTEFSFKSLSGKNFDVLHMATHGFWWGTDVDENGKYISPMNRSGLVLSGSEEEPLSSDKAGVLFAQEISELDLSSVDLLVLSACQTAGGEILEDGVFGMQRGFKQAGVGTIVMTLWPVNSAMTQSFMTGFYENLADGHDTRSAFYKARNAIRMVYPDPSYWGAFIILD